MAPDFVKAFNRLSFWKTKYNFDPKVIVDCGSAFCEWTDAVHRLYPKAKYLLIDASHRSGRLAKLHKYDFEQALLSDTAGPVEIYVRDDDSDSVIATEELSYAAQNGYVKFHKETVISTTLDQVIDKHRINPADIGLVKMDLQGHELKALDGFQYLNVGKPMLYLEISTVEYNKGQPLVKEMVDYLDRRGYYLREVVHQLYVNGDFAQFDAIFTPKEHRWIDIPVVNTESGERRLLALSSFLNANAGDDAVGVADTSE